MSNPADSFYGLEPETIFRSIETVGLIPTGELRQLNSYENRVFELFLEEPVKETKDQRVVAKFYRPGRWSRESIQEEHDFLWELKDNDAPVVAPLKFGGKTLFSAGGSQASGNNKKKTDGRIISSVGGSQTDDGMMFTIFPKIHGRMPDEILPTEAHKVGVLMAQVHSIGQRADFKYRPEMGSTPYTLWENLDLLSEHVAVEVWPRYQEAARQLIETFEDTVDLGSFQRIHADFHRGNLLSNKDGFMLVDFDDCLMGPVIQDFWMLMQGLEPEDRDLLVKGYETLREFPDEQENWIPLLRGVRILNYAAWIARRWTDPSFPRLFPAFGTYNYWAEETEALEASVR